MTIMYWRLWSAADNGGEFVFARDLVGGGNGVSDVRHVRNTHAVYRFPIKGYARRRRRRVMTVVRNISTTMVVI